MGTKGLRNGAIASFVISLGLLLVGGYYAKDKVPPVPEKIVVGDKVLAEKADIMRG